MNRVTAPIGIFDSGLGGLSVANQVRALLPAEDMLYFADSAYCPYGGRPHDEIVQRCQAVTSALLARGVKLLIVACNTACAVALADLRQQTTIPIIGLEPAVKPAVKLSQSGKIAVLATPTTVTSSRLANLIRDHGADFSVDTVAASGWVELVEQGHLTGPDVESVIRSLVDPLVDQGVDVIVLGCTHYPFLHDEIQRIAGAGVQLVDSGLAIANRVKVVLEDESLLRTDRVGGGQLTVLTSGIAADVGAVAGRLLSTEIEISTLAV